MKLFWLKRVRSFGYALQGMAYSLRTQPNTWLHAFVTVAIVALAAWLGVDARDWAVLVAMMGLVWSAEFMNTAIESVVDLASPEQHALAKAGKDAGAGAVLVAAIASVIVGLLVLGPPLWHKLFG